MKLKMFSVFDQAANAYLPPFFLPTADMAVRTFRDCAQDDKHAFGAHPADYHLFELGEFDDNSGNFEQTDTPVRLASGLQFQTSEYLADRDASMANILEEDVMQ